MSVYKWPFDLKPASQVWGLTSRAAVSPSPLTAYSQTISRTGQYYSCSMAFRNLQAEKRARLIAFLNLIADQSDLVLVPDFAAPAPDMEVGSIITNGECLSLTGWTDNDGTNYLADGWIMNRSTSAANPHQTIQEITSGNYVADGRYALMFNVRNDDNGNDIDCLIGTTAGASDITSETGIVDGFALVTFNAPSSGSLFITFQGGTTYSLERHFYIGNVSCCAALQIDATLINAGLGQKIRFAGYDEHTAGNMQTFPAAAAFSIAQPADMFELKHTLFAARANLATGNDEGLAQFTPPIRDAVTAGLDILLGDNAVARMRLAKPGFSRSDSPSLSTSAATEIQVDFVEAFA